MFTSGITMMDMMDISRISSDDDNKSKDKNEECSNKDLFKLLLLSNDKRKMEILEILYKQLDK